MFGAKDAYIIISNQLKAMSPRTYKKQERAINKTLGYKQLPAFGIFKLVLTISITVKLPARVQFLVSVCRSNYWQSFFRRCTSFSEQSYRIHS